MKLALEDNSILPIARVLLALGALLAFSWAARADSVLQVTESVPFANGAVNLSFDWNTVKDTVYNAVATGGFTLEGFGINSAYNSIDVMLWRSPAGYFEEDPEYDIGNSRQILPSPGTYTIMIYEYCATCPVPDAYNVFGTDAVVTKLHGNQHNFASLNFAGPVATPEPSVWMLCLAALAAFSWLPMRSFVGRGITVLR